METNYDRIHDIKCIWFTGLSGTGKTTLANMLAKYSKSIVLDGDVIREGLSNDLDLSEQGRHENIRRIAELAKLLISQGHQVIVAAISKDVKSRTIAKHIIGDGYIEVYVKSTDNTRRQRDTKGFYRHAVKLLSDYELSNYPYIEICTDNTSESSAFEELKLKLNKWIS